MSALVRRRLEAGGVVQGVGFRPFVFAMATELGLVGFVRNETTHVHIEVEGPAAVVDRFEHRLQTDAPPMARLDSLEVGELPCRSEQDFEIATSARITGPRTPALIPPDTAVCQDCLDELLDPTDRRYRHPFITCTNCGPRFTIITDLPYDRANTTMRHLTLCETCAAEYANPLDRRHHAQPLACNECGPTLRYERDDHVTSGTDEALARVLTDLDAGCIVAIKGIGGYHLAVDATNDQAVGRLRSRKARLDKPFAIMVADSENSRRFARIDQAERDALETPARPVVLLRAHSRSELSPAVSEGNPLVGVMLPSSPLHHLLFQPVPGHRVRVPTALVMTSGNVASEPICCEDSDARTRLAHIADSFCVHDRPIHTPCDDSVTRVLDGVEFPIRRSRGFAPLPIRLPMPVSPTLAVGGEIKNTFAVAKGHTAWVSQHIGDMENLETVRAFEASVELFTQVHDVAPETLAVDAHPRYRTRRWAHANAGACNVVEVQHHHAHLASLMAEHGRDGSEPMMGFVFDGTGYGQDGGLWGGEVLIGDYASYERWGHLREVQLPGGDSSVRNPCRTALAHLSAAGIEWSADLAPVQACDRIELGILARQLDGGSGCITSTSMGRLFDATASLLGLRHRITYEAQAAIELEVLATDGPADGPSLQFTVDADGVIDPAPALGDLVDGVRAGIDRRALARAFHVAVVDAMAASADKIRSSRSIEVVGLTGGVFQNVLLTSLAGSRLRSLGFEVLTHRVVPPNDGGLALGQLMVACHQRDGSPKSCA